MILADIAEFVTTLPRVGGIAGLDLGDKTIGVALSDLRRSVATPVEVIRREKFTLDATRLLTLLTARGATGIILGLPLNMDGSEGPRVQSTRAFARNLEKLTPLPITFWDERLSTVAAERALLEADTSRKGRKEVIDKVAAGYILQGALDRMTYMTARLDEQ
ncbi:MAG: Holliday junction resolvase RuvX [Paracoccaceae bacterium]